MKKRFLFSTLLLLTTFLVQAQMEYHHGGGLNLMAALDSTGGGGFGLTYKMRFNVAEAGDNGAIAVSAYPGFGFSGSANSRTGGSFNYTYELPLLATYNLGRFATEKSDGNIGFFVGAGYNLYGFSDSDGNSVKGNGIVGMLGLRFAVRDQPIELNISYSTGHKVLGLRLLYLFERG